MGELFPKHLAQVFRGRSRFATSGYTFNPNTYTFVILEHRTFDACQLSVGRDASRQLLQKGRPEKPVVDVLVEHTGCFDDTVEFLGTFLRGGDLRLDLRPFPLHRGQLTFNCEGPVGVPRVIEEKQRAKADEHHHPDLERIALALPLFQNLLVEEVEMKCHRPVSYSDIRTRRRRRR